MTGAAGQPTGEVRIRLLAPEDNRLVFACGNIEIDRFFQLYAGQNQFRHHIGSTYIALAGDAIAGFVTVSPGEITAEAITAVLKKKLPAYPIPILRIARLAVDARFQGRGMESFCSGPCSNSRWNCGSVLVARALLPMPNRVR